MPRIQVLVRLCFHERLSCSGRVLPHPWWVIVLMPIVDPQKVIIDTQEGRSVALILHSFPNSNIGNICVAPQTGQSVGRFV